MSSFYVTVMRLTAPILFAIAVLILVASVIGTIAALQSMSGRDGTSSFSPLVEAGYALVIGLQAAAWPLVGAAIVWRADRWAAGKGVAEQ